jgi:hypothetical protein
MLNADILQDYSTYLEDALAIFAETLQNQVSSLFIPEIRSYMEKPRTRIMLIVLIHWAKCI